MCISVVALQPHALELYARTARHLAGRVGHAVERLVVEHHRVVVERQAHVELDAPARLDRAVEGGEAVLRHALRQVVQPAMREGLALQERQHLIVHVLRGPEHPNGQNPVE
jgi:hypothetical protein